MARSAIRALADELLAEFESLADPERAANQSWYLKSPPDIRHIGLKVPEIRKIAKAFIRSHKEIEQRDLPLLVDELWSRKTHETRMAAIELLDTRRKQLTPDDVALIERLIAESHTWAYVDALSGHTMGELVEHHPELNATLDRWSTHENFWLRRASILSLLGPIRAGAGDFDRLGRYADSMLHEKEFFIRKAIGWALRETSKKRPDLVYEWLKPRAHRCSMLTIREGTKYLPPEQAKILIAAAKSGEPIRG